MKLDKFSRRQAENVSRNFNNAKRGFYFALDSCLTVMRDTEQGQTRLLRGEYNNEGKEKMKNETV